VRLYRSTKDRTRWFAFGAELGWVTFPAEVAGWQKRQRAIGVDPNDLREVPVRMGFNTGIPGAPILASGTSDLPLPIVPNITEHNRKDCKVVFISCAPKRGGAAVPFWRNGVVSEADRKVVDLAAVRQVKGKQSGGDAA
jgi:hypothetical protein